MGKSLRELRADCLLSQQELADKADVSKKTIVDIENGNVEHPQWKTIRKLAEALGVKPSDVEEFSGVLEGKIAA
jgi:DNA-binding XRE family transcriptional regulator